MNTDNNNNGHRQRLCDNFLKSGLEGFYDYEIIELLLTRGTSRKDCKSIAKESLKIFKTLSGALGANPKYLKKNKGKGDNNIFGLKIAQAVGGSFLSEEILNKDFIRSSDEVINYLKYNLRDKNREVFLVIYLNGRNQILKMENLFEGTLSTTAEYQREVVSRALDNNAAALIFVHNYPSGNPNPISDDLTITKKLKEATKSIDISVHDHLIIAGDETYSFADHGIL